MKVEVVFIVQAHRGLDLTPSLTIHSDPLSVRDRLWEIMRDEDLTWNDLAFGEHMLNQMPHEACGHNYYVQLSTEEHGEVEAVVKVTTTHVRGDEA